jgi:type II secretory pathway component PulF
MAKSAKKMKKNAHLIKAAKSLNVIEEYYAKILCAFAGGTRLKIYRKLASLLRNRFSLMDALERIHDIVTNGGKNPKEPLAIAIACWSRSLQNGEPFSDALKGWAPSRERLMLSVGDVSDMESALDNLIKVTEGSSRMIGPLTSALGYPAFLMMMAILIIYGIGVYMVPPMIDAAPNTIWKGTAKDLVSVSYWIAEYWLFAFSSLPTLFVIIFFSLSRWTGKVRVMFDQFPPWSLYRIFTGVSWLLALTALVKAGTPVSSAMRSLRGESSKYLKERIDAALVYINNGDNLGDALYKTDMGFPDNEVIGDLRIYSELDNFEVALEQMANEWLEESVSGITQKASILNMIAIFAVGGVISWAVLGTFDMQDQITNAMG